VGRYIGVRFESDNIFILDAYTIEWVPTGNF
jgi:hypothetical protein